MNALPAILAANAAAAAARAERAHLDAFRVAGATAPERALLPEQLGLARDDAFARLASRAFLKETVGGACYLDEAAVIAHRDRPARPQRALLVVLVLLLVAAGAVLAGLVQRSRERARGSNGGARVAGAAALVAPTTEVGR